MKLFHIVLYRINFLCIHLCLEIQDLNWLNAKVIILIMKRFLKGFDLLLALIMYTYYKNIEIKVLDSDSLKWNHTSRKWENEAIAVMSK